MGPARPWSLVSQAARELRIARQTLHRVLAGAAAVSPEMTTRLARLSGTPHFWLDRQQQHDLWHAELALTGVLGLILAHTLPAALQKEIGHRDDQ